MAKFFGKIGYVQSVEKVNIIDPIPPETEPTEEKTGVWIHTVTERDYSGDVVRLTQHWNSTIDKTNDDLNLNNRISIVADDFAYQNFSAIRYVTWNGVRWKVSSIEVQRPRLVLSLGGVYNGPTATVT